MAKSGIIMAVISLIGMIIASVINTYCCVCSPLAGAILGLAAGALCAYSEKLTDPEKAMIRGALTGMIAGVGALIGETVGGTITTIIAGSGQTPVACLPGLCELASAPSSRTAWNLSAFFSSCFCALIVFAVMAAMGAVGGRLWLWYINRPKSNPPPSVAGLPPV